MTGKEIVLNAMRFEKTPRMPVAILDGYVWVLRRNQLSFRQLLEMENGGAEVVIQSFEDAQTDIIHSNSHTFNFLFEIMGGSIVYDTPGEPFQVAQTPLAEMADIEKYDLDEVWEALLNRPEYEAGNQLLEALTEHFGEDKLIAGMSAGPFTLAAMLMGVQNFMMEIYEEEEMAEKLLDFATEIAIRLFEVQIEHGAEAIMIAEPVASGDLISPAMFEEFALPCIQKVIDRLKKYELPIMLHMCGHTEARLEILKEVGIDAFSLEAVDLKEALEVTRGSYTIMGNMSPFAVIQSMSPEEVYNTCKEIGEITGLEGGYIMMPGCDLTPASPIENIQAMVKAAYDITAE